FVYNTSLPTGAFIQDATMSLNVYFANGNVTSLLPLQVAKATSVTFASGAALASFSFTVGSVGVTTPTTTNANALLTNGSFGANPLYLSVQFATASNFNNAYDNAFLTDGHLAIHYLIP